MKVVLGVVVVLACVVQSALAQGYSTTFDDMTGWLPGSTSPPVNWAMDGTPSSVPGGAARTGPNSLNYNNGINYDSPGTSNAGPVFSPVIPLAKDFKEAVILRQPVGIYKKRSAAAKVITGLADELLTRINDRIGTGHRRVA